MKKTSILFLLIMATSALRCQEGPKTKHITIPPFDIVQTDGRHYRFTELKAGLPVMIVYFDPDCDHCEKFIGDLLKHADAFKNIQVVLVTYVPVRSVKSFIVKTGISDYPQFKTGTEGNTFVVRYHYNVVQFPYVALHDKSGMLIASFESEVPPAADLAAMFTSVNGRLN